MSVSNSRDFRCGSSHFGLPQNTLYSFSGMRSCSFCHHIFVIGFFGDNYLNVGWNLLLSPWSPGVPWPFRGLALSGPVGQLLDISSKFLQRFSVPVKMVHPSQLLDPIPALEHLHNICVPHLCRTSAACPFRTQCLIFFWAVQFLCPTMASNW